MKSVFYHLEFSPEEYYNVLNELMKGVLNAEDNLQYKPIMFELLAPNFTDDTHIEPHDSCIARNQRIYQHILKEDHKSFQDKKFFLDTENDRVYEWINNSQSPPYIHIKAYRTNCFSYKLEH